MKHQTKEARDFINSLARGLTILEAFNSSNPILGITDLSRKTGLSKSTVFRLVHTLRSLRYITIVPGENKYTLGPRVLGLGFAVLSSLELREVAQPYLMELSRQIEETVNLAVLDGWRLIYLERIKTQQIVNINLHVGSRLELYNTAMGRVLAAYQEEDWLFQYLKYLGKIPEAKSYCENRGKRLNRILYDVREKDYAINDEELTPGLRSVASPVRKREEIVVGAVNIAVSSSLYSRQRLKRELILPLRETTEDISLALGFEPENKEKK